MKTNDIKKGMRVKLSNGWYGTMADNARGNIRMVTVEGLYTETGSVYAHDILWCWPAFGQKPQPVEHTEAQIKLRERVSTMGF